MLDWPESTEYLRLENARTNARACIGGEERERLDGCTVEREIERKGTKEKEREEQNGLSFFLWSLAPPPSRAFEISILQILDGVIRVGGDTHHAALTRRWDPTGVIRREVQGH